MITLKTLIPVVSVLKNVSAETFLSFDKVSSRLIPRAQLGVLWKFICRTVALELLAHKAFRDQFITLSDTDNKFFAYYSWFRRI